MGEDAARGLSGKWPEAEKMLKGIWRQEPGGMSWREARPVVHYAWPDEGVTEGGESSKPIPGNL
jgi:hypothetical protein